jgi:hypothetical protein
MKRIAALGATVLGVLAIPTAAMASTSSSGGSGASYETTAQVQPQECYVGYHQVHHHSQKYFDWWENGRLYTGPVCPVSDQIPLPPPNVCGRTLTFSVAEGSHAMTEVSGPELWPTEQFIYDGNVYTIMSINPGADQFTAFVNNLLYTNNSGAAITDAVGVIISCSS